MGKLKKTPVALSAINAIAILLSIGACAGLIFTFVSLMDGGNVVRPAFFTALSLLFGILFGGIYHIVKAACYYIEEKEEGENTISQQ